jgi:hypothetical protein
MVTITMVMEAVMVIMVEANLPEPNQVSMSNQAFSL